MKKQCLFCERERKLTFEHVFPASIGGVTGARITCSECNEALGNEFEDFFAAELAVHRYALRIKNSRTKKIPSVSATADIGGFDVKLRLHSDGSYTVDEANDFMLKEVVREDGKIGWDIFALSPKGLEKGKAEATKRGAKRFSENDLPKDLLIVPVSRGNWDFVADRRAFRAAAKVALVGLASQRRALARSDAYSPVKRFIRYDEGPPRSSLFFNPEFAKRTEAGPHQHAIYYCFDFSTKTVRAIVVYFGALFYLVELAADTRSIDYGFSHIEDTLTRRRGTVLVSRLENECEAIRDVTSSRLTRFNDVLASAQHYTNHIRRFSRKSDIFLTEKRIPINGT